MVVEVEWKGLEGKKIVGGGGGARGGKERKEANGGACRLEAALRRWV